MILQDQKQHRCLYVIKEHAGRTCEYFNTVACLFALLIYSGYPAGFLAKQPQASL